MRLKLAKQITKIVLGAEPIPETLEVIDGIELIKVLNYYARLMEKRDALKYIVELANSKTQTIFDAEDIERLNAMCHDAVVYPTTIGSICRMITQGFNLPEKYLEKILPAVRAIEFIPKTSGSKHLPKLNNKEYVHNLLRKFTVGMGEYQKPERKPRTPSTKPRNMKPTLASTVRQAKEYIKTKGYQHPHYTPQDKMMWWKQGKGKNMIRNTMSVVDALKSIKKGMTIGGVVRKYAEFTL